MTYNTFVALEHYNSKTLNSWTNTSSFEIFEHITSLKHGISTIRQLG